MASYHHRSIASALATLSDQAAGIWTPVIKSAAMTTPASEETTFWSPQNIFLVVLPALTFALLLGNGKHVEPLFIHGTYYLLMALVVAWTAVYLIAARNLSRATVWAWVRENRSGLIVAAIVTAVAAIAVHPALRILADETNLLGTSKSFFDHKTATFTINGKNYYDTFWDGGVVVDRRPTLFPFLVSLVHAARGYAPANAFLFNLFVLPFFVLTSYRLAKLLGGETVGVAAALLVSAHPITIICVRSGGFDFLAAFFSVLVVKSFLVHCRAPSADRLAVLWMNVCMFAEIRYETGLFIAPVVFFLLLFRLAKLEYLRPYRWMYALTPIFLMPRIWQAILRGNVPEQDPGAVTFSVGNLVTNTVAYFKPLATPFDNRAPHAALVVALGVVGLVLAARWLWKQLEQRERWTPELQFSAMVAGWMVLLLIVVFTYVWGRPGHPASARLLISIDTFLSFFAAWAVAATLRKARPALSAMVCVAIFATYLPVASQGRLIKELMLAREASEVWRFFDDLHEKRILIVCERPGLFSVMNYGAVDFAQARQDPSLLEGLSRHLYYDIYLVQQVDLATKQPRPEQDVWPGVPRVTMLEFQNDVNGTVRISRLLR